MRIVVVGTGYVGLVVGACLAENGNRVSCVDVDKTKIDNLKKGKIPIYEPGLQELVDRNCAEKRLVFSDQLEKSVKESEIVFIAVGTPTGDDGAADLKHVIEVAREIGRAMNGYKVIVNKSTVPVGTAERVRKIIKKETTHSFGVVSNPEFLKQGAAIDDFMRPNRVVIGAEDSKAVDMMKELYGPLTRTGAPIMVMDCASAELAKYAANAMLATRISFMNEIANICELFGADVGQVRQAMASDHRIGSAFLFPGVGYGGSCFPKDIKALVNFAKSKGYSSEILRSVERVNQNQKLRLVKKICDRFGKANLKGKRFGVWGLSFKPRTDDMREAPSIVIVNSLIEYGAEVVAYDPESEISARRIFGDKIKLVKQSYDALDGADALIVITEWNEFREPDFDRMRKLMRHPIVFDGRNLFSVEQMQAQGFEYISIGR
jgi:UDPglucose 6-dehydrogenase